MSTLQRRAQCGSAWGSGAKGSQPQDVAEPAASLLEAPSPGTMRAREDRLALDFGLLVDAIAEAVAARLDASAVPTTDGWRLLNVGGRGSPRVFDAVGAGAGEARGPRGRAARRRALAFDVEDLRAFAAERHVGGSNRLSELAVTGEPRRHVRLNQAVRVKAALCVAPSERRLVTVNSSG